MNRSDALRAAPDIITAEASAWIAQLETGDLTESDVAEFREWLGRSPRHAAEVLRMARLSKDVNVLTELARPVRFAAESYRPHIRRGSSSRLRRIGTFSGVAAACTALLVAALMKWHTLSVSHVEQFETARGGLERHTLRDGSVLTLNANTHVVVNYGDSQREIVLNRGELFVQVAPDKTKPLFVTTGRVAVRAIGTAFGVRRDDNAQICVTVTEGKVWLDNATDSSTAHNADATSPPVYRRGQPHTKDRLRESLKLSAGQIVSVGDSSSPARVISVSSEEVARRLSWRFGMLEFSEAPLHEVVREVSRQTGITIRIVDPEIQDIKFGGVFPSDNPDMLFDALQTAYGINVVYLNDKTVLLDKRDHSRG